MRVGDVAATLGVSANTVRRWTDVGRIAAHRSPGGHRRYLAEDVAALLPELAGAGTAQPGDFAELRRHSQDLRSTLQAGLSLVSLLADDPHEVPAETARLLCELTGAPRCDVYLGDGETLRLAVSVEDGELDHGRPGAARRLPDWAPVDDPAAAGVVCLQAAGRGLSARARRALQRRGCRSLAWAPLVLHGEIVGALELTDAGDRDFAQHADALEGLARICGEAVGIRRTMGELASRDKTVRELVDFSREVAQTHDFERFVLRFAQRLLTAAGADCVDVWRVSGGVIRMAVSCTREGVDASLKDKVLDTSRYPSLEQTLLDHTPLIVQDLEDERLGPAEREAMRDWGYASSLTMPLVAGGEMVGLVDLYDDAERDWGSDLEFVTSACQLVAGVFDSTALLDEAREIDRLRGELIALGADLAGADELTDIAERAARRLHDVVGCTDCDIWWSEEGYLRCLASFDDGGLDESVRGRTLRLDHFPSTRETLQKRETLIVGTLDDGRLTEYEIADMSEYGFHSTASVPLVSAGQVVGMIDLFDVRERDYNEVRWFLPEVGRTVADAMRNADLLAGLRRGNAALRELVELGDRLNESGTLEDLARAVAERLRTTLSAEDCDIWQVDGGVLRCLASVDGRGWDAEEVGSERELSVYEATVAALAADEPMVVGDLDASDLDETERQAYARWGYRSMVSLPLVVGGRPIGLIDVFDTRVRDYTVHLDLIRNVGRLLAGSFEKAMLVERLESGNRDLRLLVDSSIAFGASLDVEEVLREVTQRILDISEADMCDVLRVDGDEVEILVALGGDWDEDPVGMRYPVADYGLYQTAITEQRPVTCTDILSEPMTQMEREEAILWGYRASMDIPLITKGDVIGFLSVYNRDVRPFAREDVVVGLAQLANQAIANAGVYRQLDDNLRRVALVSESALELAGSLDLEATLLATAQRLCEAVGVRECKVVAVEGDGLHPLMRVRDGNVDETAPGERMALADAAVTREVIETKRPVVVGSLRDPRLTPAVREVNKDTALKSWAVLPLIVKDRVIGTAELIEDGAERTFTQAELDTAAAICHAAALAIDNAALFAREQQSAHETRLLNDIAARTAASLDLEEVVEAAVDELGQLMTFDGYALLLLDGDTVGRVIASRPDAAGSVTGLLVDDFGPGTVERVTAEGVTVLRLPEDLPALAGSPALEGIAAVTLIALSSETGLLGALALQSPDPNAFLEVDRHLLLRVGTQLSLAIKNARLYDEIKQMHLGNLKALSSALNAKDYYTLGHAARVAAYSVMLGRRLGWPEDLLGPLEEAAYLHDIGKISISDRVLLKPGRLNQQEWDQMREHPAVSADIIRPLFPADLVLAVRHHHERYDGGGYPDGLAGEDIPVVARAMAVVDAYDAMSCRRPYKSALTYEQCVAELRHCRGTQFDPEMVDAFLLVLEDVAVRKASADEIAAAAAARIRGDTHAALLNLDDEQSDAYRDIAAVLREVRDANPPTRFLTTHAQLEKRYVIGVDAEEVEADRSRLGAEIFADDELQQVLEGRQRQVNAVYADEFGVWITGLAPIRDDAGRIVAAVAADLPALSLSESESLRGERGQTFAAMLQTAAVRLSRAEIDAITDALTGLYNHRYLHERLSEELRRARDLQRPLSVLFCDLDHFKSYNDGNGHSAGDAVLREVSHLIEESVRNIDVAARYGGEEFVVLLVETGKEMALMVAERIRARIREAGFAVDGVPLTVSIGVSAYPEDADRREDLLNKADWAMYLAKRRGRDQVAGFGDG